VLSLLDRLVALYRVLTSNITPARRIQHICLRTRQTCVRKYMLFLGVTMRRHMMIMCLPQLVTFERGLIEGLGQFAPAEQCDRRKGYPMAVVPTL
jgi:hypothetical protein